MRHNFKVIEKKWQKKWEDAKVFEAQDFSDKKKFYGLVEFPYPSGAGMHVGHIKAYSSVEVVSRKRRMEGLQRIVPNRIRCIWSANRELCNQDRYPSASDHRSEYRAILPSS